MRSISFILDFCVMHDLHEISAFMYDFTILYTISMFIWDFCVSKIDFHIWCLISGTHICFLLFYVIYEFQIQFKRFIHGLCVFYIWILRFICDFCVWYLILCFALLLETFALDLNNHWTTFGILLDDCLTTFGRLLDDLLTTLGTTFEDYWLAFG